MIRQLAGADPERWIAAALAGDDRAETIARRVLGAIGLTDEPAQAVETFWAVRRLFEAVARERPLLRRGRGRALGRSRRCSTCSST